jgi:hypothetical protein
MHSELSFDQAPPISVPYRFFLTAPWFGVAAGVLLAIYGSAALTSRWAPETLAVVHLFTAGFMLQAMCGALLQFVPVAAGGNVVHPKRIAWLVHPPLLGGTLLLVGGFLSGQSLLLLSAVPLFAIGGTVFIIALFGALHRIKVTNPTLTALKLALLALAATLALGILLALALGKGWALPLLDLTDVHVAFGLGSWGLVLLLGVSAYVVPMFQLTPAYPVPFVRRMPWWIVGISLTSVLPLSSTMPWASWITAIGMLGLATGYAVLTIRLQMQRRRRVTDPSFWFFRGGMSAVVLAMCTGMAHAIAPAELAAPLLLSTGVLILGAFVSVISGMMYKIVPFINWLHLQRLTQKINGIGSMPPSMRLMIPESRQQRQMVLHFVAFSVLLIAVWWPPLSHAAGVLIAASSAWLGVNLIGAMRRYKDFERKMYAATDSANETTS